MTSILDSVNERKETINKNYNQDSQVQLIQEYKDAIFSNIDDCREYLSSSNYAPSMNLIYSLDSMKAAIESSNAIDLYTFIETIIDATSTYVVPFSCKGAFDKTVSALSNIASVSMNYEARLDIIESSMENNTFILESMIAAIEYNTKSIDPFYIFIEEMLDNQPTTAEADLSNEHFLCGAITYDGEI